MTILESPYRSPLAVVEAIKNIIKDKVVCDLGCACGDLMLEMKKYTKEVIGIDDKKDRIVIAKDQGLNVIEGDVFKDDIPEADVYYLWIVKYVIKKVLDRIPKGTVIIGADPTFQAEDKYIEELKLDGEWIEVPYNEGDGWRQKGIFRLFITEIK